MMVDFPEPKELDELRTYEAPYCVSIYVPFAPRGSGNPSRIELKNLMHEAKLALHAAGMPHHKIKKTLHNVKQLIDFDELWPPRHESMALFAHEKFFRYYRIPDHDIPHLVAVGQKFNLKPLLTAMHQNRSYFVLALGHKNVRLYEGDHFHLEMVRLEKFPADMNTVLGIDEQPKWRETHTIAPAASGKGSEAYHGQYNVSQVDKEELEEFFRIVDRRLHYYLTTQGKPLILAGVKRLLPIYRKVNTYPHVWPESITGNIKDDRPGTIKDKAWELVANS